MPEEAPVTTTDFPFSFIMSATFRLFGLDCNYIIARFPFLCAYDSVVTPFFRASQEWRPWSAHPWPD